jgi:hypothetical protein
MTRRIIEAGEKLGIAIHDHIVIGRGGPCQLQEPEADLNAHFLLTQYSAPRARPMKGVALKPMLIARASVARRRHYPPRIGLFADPGWVSNSSLTSITPGSLAE